MNILLTGMQRSGTTLLRRIFTIHPQVKRMFHESFFLTKCANPTLLTRRITATNINPKKDIWGEKCPYYPNIRKIKPEDYCEKLHRWYPKKFRVIHIVRHPIDVANSNVKKFKYVKNIQSPIAMYKRIIPRIVSAFFDAPYVLNVKYEHLLMNPDIVIPEMYDFCNLKPDVDYKARLKKLANKKYQEINSDRAFAFRNSEQKLKVSFKDVFAVVNKIDGPKY